MHSDHPTWDPSQYLRHAGHRTRPFLDLLARIPELPHGERPPASPTSAAAPATSPPCSPTAGPPPTSPATTTPRDARTRPDGPRGPHRRRRPARLRPADAAHWTPDGAVRPDRLQRRAAVGPRPPRRPSPSGSTPSPPAAPSPSRSPATSPRPATPCSRELCGTPRWRDRLGDHGRRYVARPRTRRLPRPPRRPRLRGRRLGDHVPPAPDRARTRCSTGSRAPPCARSSPHSRTTRRPSDASSAEYRDLLRKAYPPGPHGTVFPFRRIFAVARKGALMLAAVDHVQLAAPPGSEDRPARVLRRTSSA